MTTNQKSQNAWVEDLNKSVNDIQQKELNILKKRVIRKIGDL